LEYAAGLASKDYEVSIGFCSESPDNHPLVVSNFERNFRIIPYKDFSYLDSIATRQFDVGYFLKSGAIDGHRFSRIPSGVHAVFKHFEPHGNSYAYVSEWLRDEMQRKCKSLRSSEKLKIVLKGGNLMNHQDLDFVPHCVDLPKPNEDLRKAWGVPKDAYLGIRLGGYDKFDISWVQKAVPTMLESISDLFFVFINTKQFVNHPRVIFLPEIVDVQQKVNAICSANFFLHARAMGESFGLAILEAMRCKIPVFAWAGGRDLNHTHLLTSESLYKDADDLCRKVLAGSSSAQVEKNYIKSMEFTKDQVMGKFEKVFVRKLLD